MAEKLDNMLFMDFEPKRKNLFKLVVDGIPAYLVKTAALPNMKVDSTIINYMNSQRKLMGLPTFDDVSITLFDPILPDAAQMLDSWFKLMYDPRSGKAGYSQAYKKKMSIVQYGPNGTAVAEWVFEGAFPNAIDYGGVDYTTADPVEVNVTFSYDYAYIVTKM
jgi:hypothetical protein